MDAILYKTIKDLEAKVNRYETNWQSINGNYNALEFLGNPNLTSQQLTDWLADSTNKEWFTYLFSINSGITRLSSFIAAVGNSQSAMTTIVEYYAYFTRSNNAFPHTFTLFETLLGYPSFRALIFNTYAFATSLYGNTELRDVLSTSSANVVHLSVTGLGSQNIVLTSRPCLVLKSDNLVTHYNYNYNSSISSFKYALGTGPTGTWTTNSSSIVDQMLTLMNSGMIVMSNLNSLYNTVYSQSQITRTASVIYLD